MKVKEINKPLVKYDPSSDVLYIATRRGGERIRPAKDQSSPAASDGLAVDVGCVAVQKRICC